MSANNVILNCIVNDVKFTGFFGEWFMSGEDVTDTTYSHTRYDVNVAGEDFIVENIDEGSKESISAGDVFIVMPKTNHLLHADGKSFVKNYSFRIEFEIEQKTNESVALYNDIAKNLSSKPITSYYIPWASALASSIVGEIKNNAFLGMQLARSEFEKFIILLLRELVSKNDKTIENHSKKSSSGLYDDNKVVRNEKIDNFFNRSYYFQSITIENLAQDLNLSVRQVNRILKEEFHTSFHAKLIERRLMHGKKNLLITDKTVEEIALRVGFSSSSGFFVAFKKEFGMTPIEFRKLHRK